MTNLMIRGLILINALILGLLFSAGIARGQTYEVLHSFRGNDGGNPVAPLLQGPDGYFYGTTELGGQDNHGVVFKIDASGNVTIFHHFVILPCANGYKRASSIQVGRVEVGGCRFSHASGSKAVGTTSGLTVQESEITEKNWLSHPKVKSIRVMVKTTQSRLKRKSFKISERKFESCQDQYFTLRRIARDSRGNGVWFEEYFEYEDGSYDFQHYYDHAGRLRFVFAVTFAANGTRQQHRIYFDETGKRVWEVTRFLKGPGCPGCFPIPYPDDALAHEPAKAFANDEGCKEIEPQPKGGTRKA